MRPSLAKLCAAILLAGCIALPAAITPQQAAQLPPPADHPINFTQEIKPILEASCIKCHGRGKDNGGLKLDTRATLLHGGDSGPTVIPGKSAESYLIELVQGFDADSVMPKKGSRLTPAQIGLLRAWIDQGLKWDDGISFGRLEPVNLKPRRPEVPGGATTANPIDRFLEPYYAAHGFQPPGVVSDRVFARRAYLDILGLLPEPAAMEKFLGDQQPDKRSRLVRSLLADNSNYAQHWMTFWNDALRNDYRGTGYIDGGRKQITGWLYAALATNMHYDKFVARLINPGRESEGFTKGIVWRGVVNASQTPQMQAAQNISQVFMGVNLKCASCHDSFVNDLTLADAYGLAGVFADGPLEMVHCDRPTGKKAELRFLYPELGALDSGTNKTQRLRRLAEIITERQDARLTRTLVNRLWEKFLGRGLVEPVDDMEKSSWDTDLLDWLAEDFADHDFDVKHLIELMVTSRAYQFPAVGFDEKGSEDYVFRGPRVRRMSAEQFRDALGELTDVWYEQPAADIDLTKGATVLPVVPPFAARWIWNDTNAAVSAKPGTVYFRKNFKLDEIPASAIALTVADSRFTLFVNGKKAGAGENSSKIFTENIRPLLVKGENAIAIEVGNGKDEPKPAGLFFYCRLRRENAGGAEAILDFGTDGSWQCSDAKTKNWEATGFAAKDWVAASELGNDATAPWKISDKFHVLFALQPGAMNARAVRANADPLQVALGRPNREQVVTTRPSAATTLQALELTNGKELAELMKRGAENVIKDAAAAKAELIPFLYSRALARPPTAEEMQLAQETIGEPVRPADVEDLLWGLAMLPEFQLIY